MKKSILVLFSLGLFLFCFNCNGSKKATETAENTENVNVAPQERRGPGGGMRGGGGAEAYEKMIASLDLTEEQMTAMKTIQDKYSQEMTSMRQNHTGDRESMRASMKALRAKQHEEVKGVLTAEQYTTYKKFIDERQSQRGGRGGPGGPGGRGGN